MTDFKAKMHQIRFRLGLAPDPAGGAYSAPPDLLAGFGGPTSKEREREGGKERGREEREGEGRKGEGKERAMSPPLFEGSLRLWCPPPTSKSWLRHCPPTTDPVHTFTLMNIQCQCIKNLHLQQSQFTCLHDEYSVPVLQTFLFIREH